MDPMLSYDFAAIEHTIRQQIHATSARFNAALDDLRTQIAPLQQVWTTPPRRTRSSRPGGSSPRPHSTTSCSAWVTRCATAPTTSRRPIAAPPTPGVPDTPPDAVRPPRGGEPTGGRTVLPDPSVVPGGIRWWPV